MEISKGGSPAPRNPIRVGVIGATGYVGGELIRLLDRHPAVSLVGLTGRDRTGDPIGGVHPHLSSTGLTLDGELRSDVDAVFLALPHGTAAARVGALDLGFVPGQGGLDVAGIAQGGAVADEKLREASEAIARLVRS